MSRALLLVAALASRLAGQDSSTTLVDRAARLYRAARTVRASFEQTLTSPATGTTHLAKGEYFQSGRSRFALRFSDPNGDMIVDDGETLWLYLPSTAKGQVIKMPAQAGQGMNVLGQLLSAPKSSYVTVRVRDEQLDAHATAVFALSPSSGDLPFTHATLWIGTSDALIWQLEMTEPSGLVRRVRFTAVRTDAALPADALTFTMPPGVKVIDQAALFGKKP